MDEVRLKDELMARLSNELDRPALQVIDGALSSVLRNYEVSKRETRLSTNIISFPELDIFIGKMRFENYSASTVNQYQRFLTDLLIYVGKPVQEIQDSDIVECLNYYEQIRQISASTKDHKRRIASSFFAFLHDRGYIGKNPMATVDPIKYVAEVREALSTREMEKMRIACGTNIRDTLTLMSDQEILENQYMNYSKLDTYNIQNDYIVKEAIEGQSAIVDEEGHTVSEEVTAAPAIIDNLITIRLLKKSDLECKVDNNGQLIDAMSVALAQIMGG